jgi:hypothetical protein
VSFFLDKGINVDEVARYGLNAALAAINRGDFGSFRRVIDDVNAKEPRRRAAGMMALQTALVTFSAFTIEVARQNQVRYTGAQPPTREDITYALAVGGAQLNATAQLLVNLTASVRKALPGLVVSGREEPKAPKETAPLPVAVVAMPPRKTTTDIERNLAGEIVGSLQVERDF